MNETLHTVPEAARALRIKVVTLRQWMHRRKVGFVRIGRRTLITDGELCRLVRCGTELARDAAPAIDFKMAQASDHN